LTRWTRVKLRDLVEAEINALIDRPLWEQQEAIEAREKLSIELQLRQWAIFQSLSPCGWGLL
jgi:hypothetical protein